MSIHQSIETYFIALAVFLLLDGVWLGQVAPKLYRKYIGHLMAEKPNFRAAGVFYALFLVGLLVFVIVPALNRRSLGWAIGYGALFGLITYATFDLTGQAVFKKWPTVITVIDMAWGAVIAGAASALTYTLAIHSILK